MSGARRGGDDRGGASLLGKVLAQWVAAGFLGCLGVLYLVRNQDPAALAREQVVWVTAACAPPAALWVVRRHRVRPMGVLATLLRTVALLAVATGVSVVIGPLAKVDLTIVDPRRITAMLVLVWTWIVVSRFVDRRTGPSRGADGRRTGVAGKRGPADSRRGGPQPGQVWMAWVPFEEGSYGPGEPSGKDRTCLVVSASARHAYVLKITSKDKTGQHGYLPMPHGWHPWRDEESWLQVGVLHKVPNQDFRDFVCQCPTGTWRRAQALSPSGSAPDQPRSRRSGAQDRSKEQATRGSSSTSRPQRRTAGSRPRKRT
ncbi:hypothetical protein [Actinokineospora sp. NBRC 105648]|uniref:hypothetical protein n=1 Tax=Actinokineospora sp. NBRC 105648 TaxID=3032206 RepID=UPI0024A53178|nr:hypothetical protein [Actinokineospora sp. NBRC 105648]GLZ40803.1 hypothetical protein Acsp05_44270 [Actinokineospora sp. NBRC 105648]